MTFDWHVCNPSIPGPDPLCPGCCGQATYGLVVTPSRTDNHSDASLTTTSAQPGPSGADSSSSPSVAPADTASDAKGQEP